MSAQMQVTVPEGVSPGMPFQVITPNGPVQVTCPPGMSGGGLLLVNVPVPVVDAVAMGVLLPEEGAFGGDGRGGSCADVNDG